MQYNEVLEAEIKIKGLSWSQSYPNRPKLELNISQPPSLLEQPDIECCAQD